VEQAGRVAAARSSLDPPGKEDAKLCPPRLHQCTDDLVSAECTVGNEAADVARLRPTHLAVDLAVGLRDLPCRLMGRIVVSTGEGDGYAGTVEVRGVGLEALRCVGAFGQCRRHATARFAANRT